MPLRSHALEVALRSLGSYALEAHGDQIPASHTLVAAATVAEAYVDAALEALVSESVVQQSDLGRALLRKIQQDMHRTWGDRLTWLRDGFGVRVKGDKEVQDFLTLVEFRNALVHGGSRLTSRQSQDASRAIELERSLDVGLGVQTEGGRLVYGSEVGINAVKITRAFVLHLEGTIAACHPDVGY